MGKKINIKKAVFSWSSLDPNEQQIYDASFLQTIFAVVLNFVLINF
jgi:hypothetical protein